MERVREVGEFGIELRFEFLEARYGERCYFDWRSNMLAWFALFSMLPIGRVRGECLLWPP